MSTYGNGHIPIPCPACGELQSYDEARPSKPMLGPPRWAGGRRKVRDTYYHTFCRRCDVRLVYGWHIASHDRPYWRLVDGCAEGRA